MVYQPYPLSVIRIVEREAEVVSSFFRMKEQRYKSSGSGSWRSCFGDLVLFQGEKCQETARKFYRQ